MNVIALALIAGVLLAVPSSVRAECPEDLRATGQYALIVKQSRDQLELVIATQAGRILQLEQELRALTAKPAEAPKPVEETK